MSVPPFGPRDVVLVVLLVHACWTDIRTQKIKNYMTLPVMAFGVLSAPLLGFGASGLFGWLCALALTIPAWRFGGAIRAGDVKMLLAAGSLMDGEMTVRACMFTYCLALPFGIAVLAVKGRLGRLWRFWTKGERADPTIVAFAPVVAAGVALARIQPWPSLWGSE